MCESSARRLFAQPETVAPWKAGIRNAKSRTWRTAAPAGWSRPDDRVESSASTRGDRSLARPERRVAATQYASVRPSSALRGARWPAGRAVRRPVDRLKASDRRVAAEAGQSVRRHHSAPMSVSQGRSVKSPSRRGGELRRCDARSAPGGTAPRCPSTARAPGTVEPNRAQKANRR
jgi:hypothetical protein